MVVLSFFDSDEVEAGTTVALPLIKAQLRRCTTLGDDEAIIPSRLKANTGLAR